MSRLQLRHAAIGDGRSAHHVVLARGRVPGGIELGKGFGFARAPPWAAARYFLVDLEAAEALVDIGDEARLAELAVVDHVDAELDLPAHDLADGAAQPRGMGLLVDRLALLLGLDRGEQIGGPRQAADMSGENAIAACFHWVLAFPRLDASSGRV